MSTPTIPFGLHFMEEQRDATSAPRLSYDEKRDLSMVELEDGRFVPFLSLPALQGTSTFTRVRAEQDDTDAAVHDVSLGTHTKLTEVQQEQQDQDVCSFAATGTSTLTLVAQEETDSDQ